MELQHIGVNLHAGVAAVPDELRQFPERNGLCRGKPRQQRIAAQVGGHGQRLHALGRAPGAVFHDVVELPETVLEFRALGVDPVVEFPVLAAAHAGPEIEEGHILERLRTPHDLSRADDRLRVGVFGDAHSAAGGKVALA